jgi:vacuolar-type H+-ATPase subunit H
MKASLALAFLPLLGLAACNVERDPANDSTTLSIDENEVQDTVGDAGNLVEGAAGEVKEAAGEAAPVIENAARDAGQAVEKAGDRLEQGADRAAGEVREETRDNPPSR